MYTKFLFKLSYATREARRLKSCEARFLAKLIKLSYATREARRVKSCEARLLAKLISNVSTGVQTKTAMFVDIYVDMYVCMLSRKFMTLFERTKNRRELRFAPFCR